MSLRNTERVVLADLREAGFDTSGLALVEETRIALQGVQKAAALLEEEITEAVREQRHVVTAPEGQVFVVRRALFTGPADPPIELGHYAPDSIDSTELVGSFPTQTVSPLEATPFIAERIEVSRVGFMAIMGEDYRLVDFNFDRVQVEPIIEG